MGRVSVPGGLADISGYEVCRALRDEFGDAIGIVFISGDCIDPCDRVAGLLIGADDYLAKPLAGDELLARVWALARRASAYEHLNAPALRAGLTARELEVLHLLADGHDQHAIAGRLFIVQKTVAKHIERPHQAARPQPRQGGRHRLPARPTRTRPHRAACSLRAQAGVSPPWQRAR